MLLLQDVAGEGVGEVQQRIPAGSGRSSRQQGYEGTSEHTTSCIHSKTSQ